MRRTISPIIAGFLVLFISAVSVGTARGEGLETRKTPQATYPPITIWSPTATLPPIKTYGGGSSWTLPPIKTYGGGSSWTLPPIKTYGGGSSWTLPPIKTYGGGSSWTLPPIKTYGGSSGATALCADGTYSYSAHRQGTCSWHGGVSIWNP